MVVGLIVNYASAQNPLDLLSGTQKPTEYEIPQPTELNVRWWQEALKQSPQDQPYEKLDELAESLNVYLDEAKYPISNFAQKSITQFQNNLNQIKRLHIAEPEFETVIYENQEAYSLQEVYDIKRQIRSLDQEQRQRSENIEELRENARNEYETIDELIIQHRNTDPQSLSRLEIGLQWIESRSWMALFEKQLEILESRRNAVEKQIISFKNHLQDAIGKVQPNIDEVNALISNLESIQQKIIATEKKIQTANIQVTLPERDDLLGGLKMDIKKLELANHMLMRNELQLKQVNLNAHIDWINSHQADQSLDDEQLLNHVNTVNQLIAQTKNNQDRWRLLAQNILISPAMKSELKTDRKLNDASNKRYKLAQELLLNVNELDWQLERVFLVESLLTNKVIDSKDGLNRIWVQLKSFSSSAWFSFEQMANTTLFKMNETPITLMPILRLMLIVLIGFMVSKVVRFILQRVESRRKAEKSSVFFILDKLIHYLIIFLATLAGFTTLGIDFTNLTLIAGALSVGIGFGLQNIVSNFVSGLTIMFERSLKVGDYIEMDDGLTGSVVEINARSTRINTNDNIDVVIPNSDLVTNKITNWTLRDSIKRVKIPFGVAYGTDKDLVKKAAIEATENVSYTLTNMKTKEPEVWMTGFGDNSLDFLLLVWVSKYGVRRPNRIKASYLWELDTAFNKYGIEVPFPQRVLHHATDVEETTQ